MSTWFHKTFISAHEFVDSWDKQIYELTRLDFFIYLMINHLGNQLEKRFLIREKQNSRLSLTFENIGTLCFNLGDSFEYFLGDDCCEETDHNFSLDFDPYKDFLPRSRRKSGQRISYLKSFLREGMLEEQSFRVDLMEQVVLDTLLQFYYEELSLELEEDDLELIEMADFIENVMVEFIRNDGQSLLQRPQDTAIDFFEDLLQAEEDYHQGEEWSDQEDDEEESEELIWREGETPCLDASETIDHFLNSHNGHLGDDPERCARDLALFQEYLQEQAEIENIDELESEHFVEFFAVWLIQKFAQEDPAKLDLHLLFRSLARFAKWLARTHEVDHCRALGAAYEHVRNEYPRVRQCLDQYLKEYNLLDVLLYRDSDNGCQRSGFLEVKRVSNRNLRTLDLYDLQLSTDFQAVHLDSSICSRLRPGDILQATLRQEDEQWRILEIHYIFPKTARPFIY